MFSSFDISASGLTAQRFRMDVIAGNIANVNTTRTEDGEPYRRRMPVFSERNEQDFSRIFRSKMEGTEGQGVQIEEVREDTSPFKMVYEPSHPDASEEGYVAYPNVDITTEMVDLIDASRAYEANVTALDTSKNMAMQALEIGRG